MVKKTLLAVAVIAGVAAGVAFLVGQLGSIGKDTVELRDGGVLEVEVTAYRRGKFFYTNPTDLREIGIPLERIAGITFTRLGKDDRERHELVTDDGKRRRCRALRYADGTLTLLDPAGRERSGSIGAITEIDFNR
jgi:hypothetical protein